MTQNVRSPELQARFVGRVTTPPITAATLARVRELADTLQSPLRDDLYLLIARAELQEKE